MQTAHNWAPMGNSIPGEFSSGALRLAQESIDHHRDTSGQVGSWADATEVEFQDLLSALVSLGCTSVAAQAEHHGEELVLGKFRIFEERGRGGFGIVLKAYDPDLQRDVALKLPRPERILQGEDPEETLREARLAAKVEHPGIVPVFETGRWGPVWYIASAYCSGPSLRDWLVENRANLSVSAIALLMQRICETVNYAHSRGVLHLDLKPDNILLKEIENEVAPEPLITDFGLSRTARINDDDFRRRSGGTACYMAPEQRGGDDQRIGVWTDVYALGAILRDMLCALTFSETRSVSWFRSDRSLDLVAIAQKCLSAEAEHRYASAHEVAIELGRYLKGETVEARPVAWPIRTLRWMRRKPSVALASGLLAVTAVTSVVVVAYLWRQAEANLSRFQEEASITKIADQRIEQGVLNLAFLAQKARLGTARPSEDFAVELKSLKRFLFDMQDWSEYRLNSSQSESALSAAMKSLALIDSIQSNSIIEAEHAFDEGLAEWERIIDHDPNDKRWHKALAMHILTYESHSPDPDWLRWRTSGQGLTINTVEAVEPIYADLLVELASKQIARESFDRSYSMLLAAVEILESSKPTPEDVVPKLHLLLAARNLAAKAAVSLSRKQEASAHQQAALSLVASVPTPDHCDPDVAFQVAQTLRFRSHALWSEDKHEEANKALASAIEFCDRSIAAGKPGLDRYLLHGQLSLRLARHLDAGGQPTEAIAAYKYAIQVVSSGLTKIPARPRRLLSLRAVIQADLGSLLIDSLHPNEGVRALAEADRDFSELCLRSVDSKGTWLASVRTLQSLGRGYERLGRSTDSFDAYTQSLWQLKLMRQFTNHPRIDSLTRSGKKALAQLGELQTPKTTDSEIR